MSPASLVFRMYACMPPLFPPSKTIYCLYIPHHPLYISPTYCPQNPHHNIVHPISFLHIHFSCPRTNCLIIIPSIYTYPLYIVHISPSITYISPVYRIHITVKVPVPSAFRKYSIPCISGKAHTFEKRGGGHISPIYRPCIPHQNLYISYISYTHHF